MIDLHRHDMFSRFDGFGSPAELAALAKELGHTGLSTTNHGNTSGLVQTYLACKEQGIVPVLGCEGYFLPKYREKERGYHLCLYAKDLEGYGNLNRLQYEGEKQKYYNPIWTFELLERYSGGLICSTACIASYSSQCLLKGNKEQARKYLRKLQSIFGEDLYVEVQPYEVSDKGAQELINVGMIELADELGIKCVLTSDSHRGRKEDLPTYLKMHEMAGHDPEWVEGTYSERYMPTEREIKGRFVKMHSKDFGKENARSMAARMVENIDEIESKVEPDILGQLELKLPTVGKSDEDNWKEIVRQVKQGLKRRGQYNKQYIARCKEELDVIRTNGFVDYFLIVADYVNWAKDNGINVGPGRGSVCNCLVAYAMYITEVDSIRFNLDFRRFMRYDKKALPDIDIDFEMDRRGEVIDYLFNKYKGHAARVSSYGTYMFDNTVNDLAKVCGLPTSGEDVTSSEVSANKQVIKSIKQLLRKYQMEDGSVDNEALLNGPDAKQAAYYNKEYDGIITHFTKLFGKVRFIGTHAAGVAITSGDILQYSALRIDKSGAIYTCYNLADLNDINVVKFDILGLKTMQSLGECRSLSGHVGFDIDNVDDPELMEEFRLGNTCGIFQFEKDTAKQILSDIGCSAFDDVVATCAMNRPGPIGQGMPELYAHNKFHLDEVDTKSPAYQYIQESYGAIVFQEQLLLICVFVGGLEWNEADRVLKANKHGYREKAVAELAKYQKASGVDLAKKFRKGCVASGLTKEQANGLWDSLLVYSFNKGHAAGYSMISVEEMYYKHYYPAYFWYAKLKYARDDKERAEFSAHAVRDNGLVVFLPHVNYSGVAPTLRKVDGELVLQQGLSDLKGVGAKAAEAIYNERQANGVFRNYDEFYDRCKSRAVTSRTVDILTEQGALEFNKKRYVKRVTKYNSALYSRAD